MVGFWFHRNRSEEERKEVQIKMLTGYTHHFLAPLIKARLNLVHNTLDSDEDGDDGENDEEGSELSEESYVSDSD